jgi:HEAT repeat protein
MVLWSWFGISPAGRALVESLGSSDENTRTLSFVLIEKVGPKAVPVLLEALSESRNVTLLLLILGNIGEGEAEERIRSFVSHPDADVARAAEDALRMFRSRQT